MNESTKPHHTREAENDPSAEPGLHSPGRDKAKLGDAQYSVTPPREEVRAPQATEAHASCADCHAELDPARSYRTDGQEYAYHFCDAQCFGRWRSSSNDAQRSGNPPNDPG